MNKEAAEEVITSVTPDTAYPAGEAGSTSAENAHTGASISPASKPKKVLPRYLSPSLGSCHDFCKHGRKHDVEVERRLPVRFVRKTNSMDEGFNQVKDAQLQQAKGASCRKRTAQEKVGQDGKKEGFPHADIKERLSRKLVSKKLSKSTKHLPGHIHGKVEVVSEELTGNEQITSPPVEKHVIYDAALPEMSAEDALEQSININLVKPQPDDDALTDAGVLSPQIRGSSEDYNEMKLHGAIPNKRLEFAEDEPSYPVTTTPKESMDAADGSVADADAPPANLMTASSEDSVIIEVVKPPVQEISVSAESILNDRSEGSSEGSMSMELDTPRSPEDGAAKSENVPSEDLEECANELFSMNLQTTAKKMVAERETISTKAKGQQGRSKNSTTKNGDVRSLKNMKEMAKGSNTGGSMKEESSKLKFSKPRPPLTGLSGKLEVLRQNESDASGDSNTLQMKVPSPVEKTLKPVTPKLTKQAGGTKPVVPKISKQRNPYSTKNVIVSPKAKVTKLTTSSPTNKMNASAGSSILLKQRRPKNSSPSVSRCLDMRRMKLDKSTDVSAGEDNGIKQQQVSSSYKTSGSAFPRTMLKNHVNESPSRQVKSPESTRKLEETNENIKEKSLDSVSARLVQTGPKAAQQRLRNRRKSMSSETLSKCTSSPSRSSYDKEELDDFDSSTSVKRQTDHSQGKDSSRRVRRTSMVTPVTEAPTPRKLKFRRGKVITPQQPENNGPRRLRFRQTRTISQTQNRRVKVDAVDRSYVNKEAANADAEGAGTNSEAPTVVLRHQGQQEKKDAKSLFNHVIEETASKLVETRKSKVKALVGAFETVISLQDGKPVSIV